MELAKINPAVMRMVCPLTYVPLRSAALPASGPLRPTNNTLVGPL